MKIFIFLNDKAKKYGNSFGSLEKMVANTASKDENPQPAGHKYLAQTILPMTSCIICMSLDLGADLVMHCFTVDSDAFSNEEKVAVVVQVTCVEVSCSEAMLALRQSPLLVK